MRATAAVLASALVVAIITRSIGSAEPVVIAMHADAFRPPVHVAAQPQPQPKPSAPERSVLQLDSTTTTLQDESPHVPRAGDYALVIPDLSPMITVPTDLVPAGTEDVIAAIKAGWPLEVRDTALAVADCESRLDSIAVHANANSSTDYGLFQLNGGVGGKGSTLAGLGGTPDLALDVTWNAAAAYRLFLQRGWDPWACAGQLHLLLGPPPPGLYSLPPFPDTPETTTTTIPVDTEPPPGQPDHT